MPVYRFLSVIYFIAVSSHVPSGDGGLTPPCYKIQGYFVMPDQKLVKRG